MFSRCPELDGLADQLIETDVRKASALRIEETSMIERELACLRSHRDTHRPFCKTCTPMENPNNSVPVRCLAKSEIEKQLFVGQRVNVETIRETFIVISIADDGSTVELLNANGAPSMLRICALEHSVHL